MAKFYAVRKGRQPGIYRTWPDCQQQVLKFPQAEYKSFATISEANDYINQTNTLEKSNAATAKIDEDNHMLVYVDGSYEHRLKRYGYGGVMLYQGQETTFYGGGDQVDLVALRNVAGEMIGAMKAVDYAIKARAEKITIYYDYQGIAKWALGEWRTNNAHTIEYKRYMQEKSNQISIAFEKVKAHTGNKYNEMADGLAKKGVSEK